MKHIRNQCLLLIYCFTASWPGRISSTGFLVGFLAAAIFTCVNYIYGSGRTCRLLSVLYITAAFFCPEFLLFSPAVLYNMLKYKYYTGMAVLGILTLYHIAENPSQLLFSLLLGCMITFLLQYETDSYERLYARFKKTRDDSTELNLLLKEKNQALLQKQDYEIYTATLKERNRIAREIHDNVGHMLSRSILMTGAMKMVNKDTALSEPLSQLENTLNAAMTSVRDSVHDLHDDSINLEEALKSLINTFTFCPIQLEYDMGYDIPRNIKYSFIAIIKEGLNNIIRHSNATQVHILLREHPGLCQLLIADNGTTGRGFTQSGLGLINMKDRVSALGGTLQIKAEDGFRIFIIIPKERQVNT